MMISYGVQRGKDVARGERRRRIDERPQALRDLAIEVARPTQARPNVLAAQAFTLKKKTEINTDNKINKYPKFALIILCNNNAAAATPHSSDHHTSSRDIGALSLALSVIAAIDLYIHYCIYIVVYMLRYSMRC